MFSLITVPPEPTASSMYKISPIREFAYSYLHNSGKVGTGGRARGTGERERTRQRVRKGRIEDGLASTLPL